MSIRNLDEEVPVRSFFDPGELKEDETFTKDEEDESTLRRIYQILKRGHDDIDKWHAFDLTETELKIKQQIKAHQIADSIISPALELAEQALATVDEKFRKRNNK